MGGNVRCQIHSRITHLGKRGSKSALSANLVELTILAPQHLGFEVRRVASRRAFGWFERFTEGTQQALDVVSLDDKRTQLESATALVASLDVDLERAFEKLGPRTISGAMCGRVFAVRM